MGTTAHSAPPYTYELKTNAKPQRIHVLKVDLARKDLRLRATKTADRQRTTSSFATKYGCEAAVNGDFFSYQGYGAIGLAIGHFERWPNNADSSGFGFVAAGVDNTVEISEPGPVVNPPPDWMSDVVGGKPMLVHKGVRLDNSGCGSFCDRNPRTAVGLTAGGKTLILVVVDGRSSASVGATLNELGDLMKSYGAEEALNLDGGGSSTMYVKGVKNAPSDGSERVVANHLGVCVVQPFGTLTGFVREGAIANAAGGVAGATVTLSSGDSAVTDAKGLYKFDDVPAGDVTITVKSPGFRTATRTVYVAAADTTWGSLPLQAGADPVDPPAGGGEGTGVPEGGEPGTTPPSGQPAEMGGCDVGRGAPGSALALLVVVCIAACRRLRPKKT